MSRTRRGVLQAGVLVALVQGAVLGTNACSGNDKVEDVHDAGPGSGTGSSNSSASHGSARADAGTAPLPAGAKALPSSEVPAGLPASCAGQVYYVGAPTTLCPAGDTYYLCDGAEYTRYDCDEPGAGWTLEAGSPDPAGSTGSSESTGNGQSSLTLASTCSGTAGAGNALPDGFTLPADVPASCDGQVFYVSGTTPLCPASNTYFMCGGSSYTEYDCTNPCGDWALESAVPDPAASSTSTESSETSTSTGTSYTEGTCVTSGSTETLCP